MNKMTAAAVTFILSVFFLLSCPCPAAAVAADASLVSSDVLGPAGLAGQWQVVLPLKQNESLDGIYVFDRYLCVLTDRNCFFCIDRDKGRTEFVLDIAAPGLPVCRPLFYGNNFYFLVGNRLYVVDPAVGAVVKKKNLEVVGSGGGRGLARNSQRLYLTGEDDRLYAILFDGDIMQFAATADNNSAIVSVLANDRIVVFGTQRGNIVCIEPDRPQKIWQYDLSGPLDAAIVMDDGFVYAAGLDTKCYKLNADTGRPVWDGPFYAGEPLKTAPVAGRTAVYIFAGRNGLYALEKQTGKQLWHLPQAVAALCEDKTKTYALSPSAISIMDNAAGKELASLNCSRVDCWAVNMTDARIYVADRSGVIQEIAAVKQ